MKPYWTIGIVLVAMGVFVAGVNQHANALGETLYGNTMNGAVAFPTTASVSPSLQGTAWRLTSFTSEGCSATVLPGTEITAAFGADGKLTGSAGCNRYFASYQLSGNGIKIGSVGSTLMYCGEPPGVMAQETTYLKLLQGSTTYSVNADELRISDGSCANQLIFKASVPC